MPEKRDKSDFIFTDCRVCFGIGSPIELFDIENVIKKNWISRD